VRRREALFLALVAAQAAHALEEYLGRLYDVFPPAAFVSGLFSTDLRRGFSIFNVILIVFGLVCWLLPVRRDWRSAVPVAWLWVSIELMNGVGHPLWSIRQRDYTPGVATAPLLFLLAVWLARDLLRRDGCQSAPGERPS
jgi:hypothetical protein